MKKFNFLIAALIIGIGFTACSKSDYKPYDAQHYLDLETPILANYVDTAAGLEGATLDENTGIWFKVLEEGISDPEDKDNFYTYKYNSGNLLEFPKMRVKYALRLVATGKLIEEVDMNDTQYDGKYMNLGTTIGGWQYAFFPTKLVRNNGEIFELGGFTELGLQKGSKIRIVIPSPYGYQDQLQGSIPANSPLDFTIEVIEVKAP